jgi:hypothetical protein
MEDFCKHGHEFEDSINSNFLHQWSNSQLQEDCMMELFV